MAKINKHHNKYFLKQKEIIRLKKQDREINDAIRNQGYIELEKPIPHGYDAEWVLREDILRREDAWAYQEALDACKSSIWSKDKSFKARDYKTKKWYVRKPDLKAINKETYEKLSPTAKKFFVEDSLYEKRYWRYGFNDKFYRCTLSYELVVKITQSFITHRREHDNILYQMESEIESHMIRLANGVTARIWGSYRGLKYWKRQQSQKQKTNAKKEIRKQLNEE